MKILLLLISFGTFSTQMAQADRIGNGGTYVLCNNNLTQSYFYDYYELTRIKKQHAIEPKISGNAFVRAKAILARQNSNNKYFIIKASEYVDHMRQNLDIQDDRLKPTNDNPGYTVESRCELIQAVVSGWEKDRWVYNILGAAWDFMDRINQTSLILHEVIYRLASERGQLTSVNTKLLVQALLTSDENSDPNKIYKLRKQLDLVVEGE